MRREADDEVDRARTGGVITISGAFGVLFWVMHLVVALLFQNEVSPGGDPVLDPPTLHCLGVAWPVKGDANRNARIDVDVRKVGATGWNRAAPLFRVEPKLFAGSVVGLEPDTAYEIKLSLSDPDGGAAEKTLASRTRAEPKAPADLAEIHVRPGPNALRDAQRQAGPGTVLLLHAGTYEACNVIRNGEPGRPILWRPAGDGEVVLDGGGQTAVGAWGAHDVWFEGLTFRNTPKAINAGNASRLVVRGCRFLSVDYAFFCTVNDKGEVRDFFIADNVMEGPCRWPRSRGIESPRAIQVTGAGHVICHNRIRGFADAIDTMPSVTCAAIDIYRNEIEVMTDDGIELDYSERNVRCFENRLTNCFQGISLQPVLGGPAYVYRNVMMNVPGSPFKLHSSPSGVLLFHNTVVKKGPPHHVATEERVRNVVSRNNLFVGTEGPYALEASPPMVDCDFDYDGFSGGPWNLFLKWNGVRYGTAEDVRAKAPVYRHVVALAAGEFPTPGDESREAATGFEAKLKAGSGAVDVGERLPGFNDGFAGAAPDLGAVESGASLPRYGPR